jgi:hypothetical protein
LVEPFKALHDTPFPAYWTSQILGSGRTSS